MEEIEEIAGPGASMAKIQTRLFKIAIQGKWDLVVELYRKEPRACRAKITESGDTALHLAVSDGQEYIVEELVHLISIEDLQIPNERGDTPLHIAASMGSVRMCACIANLKELLVGARNVNSETPLFLAALNGRKDAFLCLHYICTATYIRIPPYNYCRRKDGDTILHCAIARNYFGNLMINLHNLLHTNI